MSEIERFLSNPHLKKIGSTEIKKINMNLEKIALTEDVVEDPLQGKRDSAKIGEPRHPDFEKIYRQFMKRYCGSPNKECEKGKQAYYAWLNAHGLDDTKPYRKPQESEAFKWAEPLIKFAKEDEGAKYYRVEALFPVSSMNRNIYTEDELIRAARTLIGKPVNMNHEAPLENVEILDAEFEDGAVEVLLKVSRDAEFEGKKIVDMIDNGEILHVSIEGACRSRKIFVTDDDVGFGCEGLVLTGLALLQKDVLPGVPLTRIEPVEKIVSEFHSDKETSSKEDKKRIENNKTELQEWEWDTAYINSLPDSAFAVIEPAYLRGETDDKRCRHLPHHDKNGKIDLPHLRNALARLNQIKPITDSISRDELIARAKRHLCAHVRQLDIDSDVCGEEKKEEAKEEKPKSPCESAKESLLARLKSLENRVKRLENIIEESTEKEAPTESISNDQSVKEPQEKIEDNTQITTEKAKKETPKILTKEGFWERFRELRKEGLSKSDAYRLTTIEILEALAKQKAK